MRGVRSVRGGAIVMTAVGVMSAAVLACSSEASSGAGDDDAVVPEAGTASADASTASQVDGSDDARRDGDAGDARDAAASADADAGADADATVDAGADAEAPVAPAVRWVGRFDTSDPAGPRVAWPGARVVVRFSGPEVRVKLAEVPGGSGPSRYDVLVDGARTQTITPAAGTSDVVLASGLGAGPHVVELYRLTESTVGVTQVRGFEFPSGGQLLAPPPAPDRRIEFLGDSASNGYGIECTGPLMNFSGATQNERKAFPGLVAAALGADHHTLAFSGKGVLRNYDGNDDQLFGLLYPRTLPQSPSSAFDFASFQPHVVWITLGGNDWDNPGNRAAPDLAAFETKYRELVAKVRAERPQAQIVLAVAGSLSDDYPPGYAALTNMTNTVAAVRAARLAVGDTKVHTHVLTRSSFPDDVTGCAYHPNAAFNAKVAPEIVAKIKAVTGWP